MWFPGLIAVRVKDPTLGERVPSPVCPPAVERIIMPAIGTEWLVYKVVTHWSKEEECELEYLVLKGQPSDYAFDARLFKKIRRAKPPAEKVSEPVPELEAV